MSEKSSTNAHFVEETGKTGFLEKLVLRGFYHKVTFAERIVAKKLVSELNYKDANFIIKLESIIKLKSTLIKDSVNFVIAKWRSIFTINTCKHFYKLRQFYYYREVQDLLHSVTDLIKWCIKRINLKHINLKHIFTKISKSKKLVS